MEKIEIGNGIMVKVPQQWSGMEMHIHDCFIYAGGSSIRVSIPKGYLILSLKSEMTEEKAREVVNQTTVNKRVLYLNYTDTEYWYKKALESFNSFCTANNLKGEYVVLIKK